MDYEIDDNEMKSMVLLHIAVCLWIGMVFCDWHCVPNLSECG